MRPELDDTLAVPASDPARTATAQRPPASAAPTAELAPGQQLGHFRIERLLGAGGMGEVHLATDLALDRPVAIKVLPAAVARNATSRDRMVREARAQARLTHPNIGHIYFIGEEAGRLYFAMEYVAGETLAVRIASGPLGIDEALSIIRSAALGLREAERKGITHRDIKPSNLMIDGHGMVKVLDFGLAAGAAGPIGSGPVAQTSMAGTPLYMAPEQARGEPVDFRADIYALGATLFHLVSGRPPFQADDLQGLLTKHASADRPVLPRRSGQPRTTIAAIDALCGRMMAPAAADRFTSYDELIRAIELASVEHTRPAGLWVRSMATLVDLCVAMLSSLAVFGLVRLVVSRFPEGDLGAFVFAMYAVVMIAFTRRYGRTPGQSLFELEVIDLVTGGKPSTRRAAIRILVPIATPMLGSAIKFTLGLYSYKLDGYGEFVVIVGTCLPAFALLWASLRSVSKQTFWDRRSGTMVRYRTRRTTTI